MTYLSISSISSCLDGNNSSRWQWLKEAFTGMSSVSSQLMTFVILEDNWDSIWDSINIHSIIYWTSQIETGLPVTLGYDIPTRAVMQLAHFTFLYYGVNRWYMNWLTSTVTKWYYQQRSYAVSPLYVPLKYWSTERQSRLIPTLS